MLDALEETIEIDPGPDHPSGRRWRGSVTRTRESAEARRGSSRLIDAGFLAMERNRRVPSTLLAGALASRIVLFLIPFLVLVVIVTGYYANALALDPVEAARDAGMTGLLAEAVEDTALARNGVRVAAVLGMLFASVWAADSLARLLRRVHALVWRVPSYRPRWRLAAPLFVFVVSLGGISISRVGLESVAWPFLGVVWVTAGELVIVTIAWILITRFLPIEPEARSWTRQLPGAVLVAVGLVGMKVATVFYLAPHAVILAERYGDIASAVIFITWAYWLAFIVVFSAELNAALFASHQRHSKAED